MSNEHKHPSQHASFTTKLLVLIAFLLPLVGIGFYSAMPVQAPIASEILRDGTRLDLCSVSYNSVVFRYDQRSRFIAWIERLEYQLGFKLPFGSRTKMVTFGSIGRDLGVVLQSNKPLVESSWQFTLAGDDGTTHQLHTLVNYRRQYHLIAAASVTSKSKYLNLQCLYRNDQTTEIANFQIENPAIASSTP